MERFLTRDTFSCSSINTAKGTSFPNTASLTSLQLVLGKKKKLKPEWFRRVLMLLLALSPNINSIKEISLIATWEQDSKQRQWCCDTHWPIIANSRERRGSDCHFKVLWPLEKESHHEVTQNQQITVRCLCRNGIKEFLKNKKKTLSMIRTKIYIR